MILSDDLISSIRHMRTPKGINLGDKASSFHGLFKNRIIESIEINYKFNYGKHGSKEIIKLFKGIDIDNIFDECKVYDYKESLTGPIEIDMKGPINSVTNHRNQIIHNDSEPNITLQQLWNYRIYFNLFAEEIIDVLKQKLIKLHTFSYR